MRVYHLSAGREARTAEAMKQLLKMAEKYKQISESTSVREVTYWVNDEGRRVFDNRGVTYSG